MTLKFFRAARSHSQSVRAWQEKNRTTVMEEQGGYRTRSRSGSSKRMVEEIVAPNCMPNCNWSRNEHELLFLIFFSIIEIFDVSYDFDNGLGDLPDNTFLFCCVIMPLLVDNIIFLHEKYLFRDDDPDYTILRDLLSLYDREFCCNLKRIRRSNRREYDIIKSFKNYIIMQGNKLENNHAPDFIENIDHVENQYIIDYIKLLVNLKYCTSIQGFDIGNSEWNLSRIDQIFNYYKDNPDTDVYIDGATVKYRDDNEVIYKYYIIMHKYRFHELNLLIYYINIKLLEFLVPLEHRPGVSIYEIIVKVLKHYDTSVTMNFNDIDMIMKNIEIFMDKVNCEMSSFIELVLFFFNHNAECYNRYIKINNSIDYTASSKSRYYKFFKRNAKLNERKRLSLEKYKLLKSAIGLRKSKKDFNLEFMVHPRFVSYIDYRHNNITASVFDNNIRDYDVDNLNMFILTSDIPTLLGCRWEASCVITPDYKLPSFYPTEKLYRHNNYIWPDIDDFQDSHMQFIILSQNPFIYAPATNVFLGHDDNNVASTPYETFIYAPATNVFLGHDDNNVASTPYEADDDNDPRGSDAEVILSDTGSATESDVTSSTNNVNDRVLRSDINGTRYEDEDDYKDYTFHKLFDDYDTQHVKSGHCVNINLGNVNKLLYTKKTLYDPADLVGFLENKTKIKYVKAVWYGSKIKNFEVYEHLINNANEEMENSAVDFDRIESNTFDIAVNYTTSGILLLQKVFNDNLDEIFENKDGEKYRRRRSRTGVSIKYFQILNGLGYSATVTLTGNASVKFGGITKIKLYPRLIHQVKGHFRGYFKERKSGYKNHEHYALIMRLYNSLKNTPNKLKDYRVEFSIKAKNIRDAVEVAFDNCSESKLSVLFTRAGRQFRYHEVTIEDYFKNVQILLNIIRHNGLSSAYQEKEKVYYANICLFDAYNAIGMNMLFLSKSKVSLG